MISTLLYVSKSTMLLPADRQIAQIVAISRERNAAEGITGALLFSEVDFAQFIEGPSDAVDALLSRLLRDDRHMNVTVVSRKTAEGRLFPRWSLAYSGPSFLVEEHIEPLFGAGEGRRDVLAAQLISILRGLTSIA